MPVSALITQTPSLIDPTNFAAGSFNQTGICIEGAIGNPAPQPFVLRYQGVYYQVLQNMVNGSGETTGAGGVFSSTDGKTWTRLDVAHQPAFGPGLSAWYPATGGNTIYVVYSLSGSNDVVVNTFNLTSLTWGTASTAAPFTWPTTSGALRITGLSNGSLWVYITTTTSLDHNAYIEYAEYAAGAWGSIQTLTTETGGTFDNLLTVITDSGDRTHILVDHTDGVTNTLDYYQVSATGAASGPTVIPDPASIVDATHATGVSFFLNASTLIIPIMSGTDNTYTTSVQAFIVTNLSATVPTFTPTTVDAGTTIVPLTSQYAVNPLGMLVGGAAQIFWIVTTVGPSPSNLPQQIYSSTYKGGGVWSGATLVYDAGTNQPGSISPGTAGGTFITTMGGTAGAGNAYLLSINMPWSITQTIAGFSMLAGASVEGSQLVFYGVRRMRSDSLQSSRGAADPMPSKYKYYEKAFQIPISFTLTAAYNSSLPLSSQIPQTVLTSISDYDFELRHLLKYAVDGNGNPLAVASPFAVLLYDSVHVVRMNLPLFAEFLFDDLNVTGNGRNFWPAPPIMYPINTVIQLDVYSTLDATVALPVTVTVLFDGVRRIPCK